MPPEPVEAQFEGCLIGQCLADATGFVVEGYPPDVCAEYVSDLRRGHVGAEGRAHFPFGQYSDDSQLARELMQSYCASRGFDPQDYAGRIASIFEEERIVGRGSATWEAARRLIQGVQWEQSGTPPPSAGNGSAMRAGPVGLFCYDDPEALLRVAHDQGRITHKDPRCSAGATAIAGAVALALRGGSIDATTYLGQLATWAARLDRSVAAALEQLPGWIRLPPSEAVTFISRAGRTPDHQDDWHGISPFVTPSVLWSLYAFLRTPDDYWETLCTAIEVGGDVDTTAAMAGAISGARVGLDALPRALCKRVTDRGTWGFDELRTLARNAYGVKHARRRI